MQEKNDTISLKAYLLILIIGIGIFIMIDEWQSNSVKKAVSDSKKEWAIQKEQENQLLEYNCKICFDAVREGTKYGRGEQILDNPVLQAEKYEIVDNRCQIYVKNISKYSISFKGYLKYTTDKGVTKELFLDHPTQAIQEQEIVELKYWGYDDFRKEKLNTAKVITKQGASGFEYEIR